MEAKKEVKPDTKTSKTPNKQETKPNNKTNAKPNNSKEPNLNKPLKEIKKEEKQEIKEKVEHNILHPYSTKLTPGQRAADALTKWAGSWTFILFFLFFLVIWMAMNVVAWINNWDPYPFILLNLVLSCLAAIQAPIILMSQNRQSQKDRVRAEYNYQMNRRAENQILEIMKQLNRIEKKIK